MLDSHLTPFPSRQLVNFTELKTWKEKRAAAIAISKRAGEELVRGKPGTPAYFKAQQEQIRQIVMNIYAHHADHEGEQNEWQKSSVWKSQKEAQEWAEAALHAMAALTRKMTHPKWIPSPVAADGCESGAASDSSETSLDEAEKKKPKGKRKLKEKKKKKPLRAMDEDDAPPRDKHYQGHIPPRLEQRLKRVWVWMANSNPPRWCTPYRMQGTAVTMEGWSDDERKAKVDYLKITTGRGELLTPGHGPEVAVGGWLNPHTTETPVSEDEVYDVVNMCVRPRTP